MARSTFHSFSNITLLITIAALFTLIPTGVAQTIAEGDPLPDEQTVVPGEPKNADLGRWTGVEHAYHAQDWDTMKVLLDQLPYDQYGEQIQLLLKEIPRTRPAFDDVMPLSPEKETEMAEGELIERRVLTEREAFIRQSQNDTLDANDKALTPPGDGSASPDHAAIQPPAYNSGEGVPEAVLTVGAACTYATVQDAVNAAFSGDTIWVHGTTWTGSSATVNINAKTLFILGGFDPTCSFLDGSRTTLDATGSPDSVIEIYGGAGLTVDLYHFGITGGSADVDYGGGIEIDNDYTVRLIDTAVFGNDSQFGGGIHMNDPGALLILEDISRIRGNTADEDGGGVFCLNGAVTLTDGSDIGVLGGNIADDDGDSTGSGGGAYLDACDLTLDAQDGTSVEIFGNQAVNGGGVYATNASLISVQDVTASINNNTATNDGGGVYLAGDADVFVDSGQVNNNIAGSSGGGVYATGTGSVADFDNLYCTTLPCAQLSNNDAGTFGGAAFVTSSAKLDLETTYVHGNQAGNAASAIYTQFSGLAELDSVMITDGTGGPSNNNTIREWTNGQVTINSSTIAGNLGNGAAIFGLEPTAQLNGFGLIIWGNDGTALVEGSGTVAINCSVLQIDHPGSDNIVADPQFVNPSAGNYHISRSSPALDHCSSGFIVDIDSEVRPNDVTGVGTPYDAGADEAFVFVGLNGNVCNYGSITDALAAASSGDTVYIPRGTYNERLGVINNDLTLTAASNDCTTAENVSPYAVTIDANNAPATWGGVVEIGAGSTITFTNLYLRDGSASFGGLIYVNSGSKAVLDDTDLGYGSATIFGGAVRSVGTTELINGSLIFSSQTTSGGNGAGVALVSLGQLILRGGSDVGFCGSGFTNSSANNGGGVYMDSGTLTMYDTSQLCNNEAVSNGGGIYATSNATINLYNSTDIGGNASSHGNNASIGAGAYLTGTAALNMYDNSDIEYNVADSYGGGVAMRGNATLLMNGSGVTARNNQATFNGGGIWISDNAVGNNPSATIQGGTQVELNTANYGGGIYMEWDGASTTISNASISDNTAASFGGGIHAYNNTTLTLDNVTMNNNEATVFSGGAISLLTGFGGSPLLDLDDTLIDGNIAGADGGGIYNSGGLLDLDATSASAAISNNTAGNNGGGIFDSSGNIMSIWANDGFPFIIDGNTATNDGGGIFTTNDVYHDVYVDVQITNNTSGNNGGGVYKDGADGWYDDLGTTRPVIAGNEATGGSGGGFYLTGVNDAGQSLFDGVIISDNIAPSAVSDGGGIYADASSFALTNVLVHTNTAGKHGGGIAAVGGSSITVNNSFTSPPSRITVNKESREFLATTCDPQLLPANTYCSEFRANIAGTSTIGYGGAILLDGASIAIVNYAAFIDNNADFGAGLYSFLGGNAITVVGSLFSGNMASFGNGSVIRLFDDGSLDLDSSTIAGNPTLAVSFDNAMASGQFDNTIIWGNAGGVSLGGVTPTGSCNDTQDGSLPGIQTDPEFITAMRGAYHLSLGSSALDACNSGPAQDLDNVARPKDGDGVVSPSEYDMGAFERGLNTPPIGVDDIYTTTEDVTFSIPVPGVLNNDIDSEGDPLIATLGSGPSNGSFTFNSDGSFVYTPTLNFHGTDQFNYLVSDSMLTDTVTATLVVQAANDSPLAINDAYTTTKNTALIVSAPGVLDNDSDIDGDLLSALPDNSPSHGTLTLNVDGSFIYTPTLNYDGTDTFTYLASDGGLTDVGSVTIIVELGETRVFLPLIRKE